MNAIADNTARAADALEAMLKGNFQKANPLGDINAVNGAIAAAPAVPPAVPAAMPVAGLNNSLATLIEKTAAAVAESSGQLRAIQDSFMNAKPLVDINAISGAIAAAARVQNAPVAGGDEALVTPMEQTAASVAESTRHLRELVGLARSGGLAFA